MIALYIDRLSVTATAAKLRVDASTVRRRRDSACDKIRKAMEENKMGMFKNTLLLAQQGKGNGEIA